MVWGFAVMAFISTSDNAVIRPRADVAASSGAVFFEKLLNAEIYGLLGSNRYGGQLWTGKMM